MPGEVRSGFLTPALARVGGADVQKWRQNVPCTCNGYPPAPASGKPRRIRHGSRPAGGSEATLRIGKADLVPTDHNLRDA